MTEQYDPNDHTVAEVQEHLATASPDEAEFIKALEAEGQNRKGIVEYVPSPEDVPPSPDGYTRVPVADPYPPGEPIKAE